MDVTGWKDKEAIAQYHRLLREVQRRDDEKEAAQKSWSSLVNRTESIEKGSSNEDASTS